MRNLFFALFVFGCGSDATVYTLKSYGNVPDKTAVELAATLSETGASAARECEKWTTADQTISGFKKLREDDAGQLRMIDVAIERVHADPAYASVHRKLVPTGYIKIELPDDASLDAATAAKSASYSTNTAFCYSNDLQGDFKEEIVIAVMDDPCNENAAAQEVYRWSADRKVFQRRSYWSYLGSAGGTVSARLFYAYEASSDSMHLDVQHSGDSQVWMISATVKGCGVKNCNNFDIVTFDEGVVQVLTGRADDDGAVFIGNGVTLGEAKSDTSNPVSATQVDAKRCTVATGLFDAVEKKWSASTPPQALPSFQAALDLNLSTAALDVSRLPTPDGSNRAYIVSSTNDGTNLFARTGWVVVSGKTVTQRYWGAVAQSKSVTLSSLQWSDAAKTVTITALP